VSRRKNGVVRAKRLREYEGTSSKEDAEKIKDKKILAQRSRKLQEKTGTEARLPLNQKFGWKTIELRPKTATTALAEGGKYATMGHLGTPKKVTQ